MFAKWGLGMKTHIWERWGRASIQGGPELKDLDAFRKEGMTRDGKGRTQSRQLKCPRHDTLNGEVPRCCDKPSLPLCSDPNTAPSV